MMPRSRSRARGATRWACKRGADDPDPQTRDRARIPARSPRPTHVVPRRAPAPGCPLDRPRRTDARGGPPRREASRHRHSDPGGDGRHRAVRDPLPRERCSLHDRARPLPLGHRAAGARRRLLHPDGTRACQRALCRPALVRDVRHAGREARRLPASAGGRARRSRRNHHRPLGGDPRHGRKQYRPAVPRRVRARRRGHAPRRGLRGVLRSLGRKGDVISNVRESMASVERMLLFLSASMARPQRAHGFHADWRTAIRDVQSIDEHATFLSNKVQFLLDATLGLVTIEQNDIIKLFSVVAVVFMPPTLVASIYGMNFKHMPELDWLDGYPMALGLMLVAAVTPYLYFRWRQWL